MTARMAEHPAATKSQARDTKLLLLDFPIISLALIPFKSAADRAMTTSTPLDDDARLSAVK